MQMKSMAAVALATSGLITSIAAGDAVEWRVADGGNGHWYQRETNGMTWDAARAFSQARGGDLVSLEAAGEWQWVSANVPGSFYLVGGYQRADATSVSEGWTWLTGSPISGLQTNFDDNPCGFGSAVEDHQQDYIEMVGAVIGDINSGLVGSCTDDGARPFLIEWSADCNNDGIVDYGQCRDGSLPDFNGNNIPDCCEQGTACAVGSYPVEWRTKDGGNGHWYQAVAHTPAVGWEAARQFAVAKGGHLATISSLAENQFVFDLSIPAGCWNGNAGPYLGAFKNSAGQFEWITGEAFGFTNWLPGEPSSGAWEPALALIGPPGTGAPGPYWNDYESVPYVGWTHSGSVIEFDADCNNDGIVDYGQILSGSLADTNANGVPDTCELSVEPFEVVALQPDPAIVSSADVRARIEGSGYPWKIRDRRNGMEFVLVPPGRLVMGSDSSDPESVADEMPAHEVILTNPL